ncbi:hypothetical protein DV738_g348, partial [Chaetothyriales sp. CBS 135597]
MPPSTPTFHLVWPTPLPDDYEENIRQLERLPAPRTANIDDALSDYNSLTSLGRASSLADIYNLGSKIVSYLYYVDQYLPTLRVVYVDKNLHFKDPLRAVFNSLAAAYQTSFVKYRKALIFSLKVLLSCKKLAPEPQQSDKDDETTEDIAINLTSFLKLRDEINTLFKTPYDSDKTEDTAAEPLFCDIEDPRSPTPFRRPPPVRDVYFITSNAPHWVLKDTTIKIPILTPETNNAFWTNMKATIPILLETLSSPGSAPEGGPSCLHLDHPSPYILPPVPESPYAYLRPYVTPPQSPKLPLDGQFQATLEEGDKFFTEFIQRMNEPPPPPKEKKTEAIKPAKVTKVTKVTKKYRKPTKIDGGKLGAQIAALAADDDALLQTGPAADQVTGRPPVSIPAAKGHHGHASHRMENKGVGSSVSQRTKDKSTMKGDDDNGGEVTTSKSKGVRSGQGVNVMQADETATGKMEED